MQSRFRYLMFTICLLGGCTKTNEPGMANFTGTATVTSPLTPGTPPVPLVNQKVTLTDATKNVSYDLLTDAQGLFSFPGLSGSDSYTVALTETLSDANQFQAVYSAAATVNAGQADISKYSLAAVLDTKTYKGILITVVDKSGGTVPGAKVVVYSSGELAKLDPDFLGYGSLCSLSSNSSGLCLAMQLPQTVYVKGLFSSSDGKVKLQSALQTVTVDTYKTISIVVQ